ncbi:hypothetical protein HK105_209188 [Polyrhizophydium stewartii]|uniref:Endo-beta-1,6-galactanase-like domain-containing protein n=1 Tax=Polyrhizophydium stewartii TaxID=2732419 RepID=A0ABR4MVQ3_9FUNG
MQGHPQPVFAFSPCPQLPLPTEPASDPAEGERRAYMGRRFSAPFALENATLEAGGAGKPHNKLPRDIASLHHQPHHLHPSSAASIPGFAAYAMQAQQQIQMQQHMLMAQQQQIQVQQHKIDQQEMVQQQQQQRSDAPGGLVGCSYSLKVHAACGPMDLPMHAEADAKHWRELDEHHAQKGIEALSARESKFKHSPFCRMSKSEHFPLSVTLCPADGPRPFRGWGTSLCWWAHALGGAADCRVQIADALFAPPPLGLGLTVVRYNIGGGDDPACVHRRPVHDTHFRDGGDVPGWQPDADEPFDDDADRRQLWFLVSARNRGADTFEAFANSPPWFMTVSGCTGGYRRPTTAAGADSPPVPHHVKNNLRKDAVEAFAAYLVEVLVRIRGRFGIEFQTLSPMNEPHPEACNWTAGNIQEGCNYDTKMQEMVILATHRKLKQQGLRTEIAASDETSSSMQVDSWLTLSKQAKACVAQINTHTYGSGDLAMVRRIASDSGKRLWMSEMCYGGSSRKHDHDAMHSPLVFAEAIARDLRTIYPECWVYWQAVEDESNARSAGGNWGFIHADMTPDASFSIQHSNSAARLWQRTKKYWAMAHFSHFIRPGSTLLSVCEDHAQAGVSCVAAISPSISGGRLAGSLAANPAGASSGANAAATTSRSSSSESLGQDWVDVSTEQLRIVSISDKKPAPCIANQSCAVPTAKSGESQGTNLVIVLVNSKCHDISVSIDMAKHGFVQHGGAEISAYRTSAKENMRVVMQRAALIDSVIPQLSSKALQICLLAESITTIVVRDVALPPPPTSIPDAPSTPRTGRNPLSYRCFSIVSVFSKRCISSDSPSSHLVQRTMNGANPNQVWMLVETPDSKPDDPIFSLVNMGTGRLADITRWDKNEGAEIATFPRTGGANQHWRLKPQKHDKCKPLPENKLAPEVAKTIGAARLEGVEDSMGCFAIISAMHGKCVDVAAWDMGDGATVLIWNFYAQENQLWTLVERPCPF